MRCEPDCCGRCDCGELVHLAGVWPPNSCPHGLAVCERCAPGECEECAEDEMRQYRIAALLLIDEHGSTHAALAALVEQARGGAA